MKEPFYKLLYEDDRFVMAVGRLAISSAKLESCIKLFLKAEGVLVKDKLPLGKLIEKLLSECKIDRTTEFSLRFILHERNYFVHRLHGNLADFPQDLVLVNRLISRANSLAAEIEVFSGLLK